MELLDFLRVLGTGLAVVMCSSPLPGIVKNGKLNKLHLVPTPFLYINHSARLMWFAYGMIRNIMSFVYVSSLTGSVSFIILCVFHFYRQTLAKFLVTYALVFSTAFYLVFSFVPFQVLGPIASATNILTYLSNVPKLKFAFSQKDSSQIDLTVTMAATLNASIWCLVALILEDYYFLAPNLVGISSGVLQVSGYFYLSSFASTKKVQ